MRYDITIASVAVLCTLAVATAATGPIGEPGQMDYSPDTIIVKLKTAVSITLPDQKGPVPSGLDLGGVSPFNAIHPGNPAANVEPLFRNFRENQKRTEALLTADRSVLSRRKEHLLQRLKRAPQNVAVPDLSRIYRVEIDLEAGQSRQKILKAYQSSPYVEYAEPDYYARLFQVPNDPNYSQQWALNKIDAPQAWDIHTGSHDVVVAVIDTGVDYTHPDLQGNIWVNEVELNGLEGVDDDENGYVDDIHGYDFAYDDGEPQDDFSHGSHIAGIIAARGNNGTSVSGICWNATIMPVKAMDPDTLGPASGISQAIYYAVANGADILSNSWGMNPPSDLLRDAFQYAYSQGVVAVAAAGNDRSSEVFYPAGYSSVISVGASRQNDRRASFSNYGDWVDIMAPGVNILSLSYYGGMRTWQGTSMACPHVSGACALMLSVNPHLTPDEVRRIVMSSGDPVASGMCSSNKRVNLFNALSSVLSPTGTVHFDSDAYGCASTISVSVADADLKASAACNVALTTDNGDVETLTLTENTPEVGAFQGSITTNAGTPAPDDGVLQVSDGEVVTVAYVDESGTGRNKNREQTHTDTAVIDGQEPVVSNVVIDASSPQPSVALETDKPTLVTIHYRPAGSQATTLRSISVPVYATEHTIVLNNVSARTDYTFVIEAVDRLGNATRDDGTPYGFTTVVNPGPIYVPADYDTIQAAIDHCWNGETVWVADGVYTGPGNRDIDFKGKAIAVRSEKGPDACIIDCEAYPENLHRAFYFHHRETPDSVLDGFTITRGVQEGESSDGTICRGGGILCNASNPTIRNCVFRDNSATYGGGIQIYNGSKVTLTGCVFADNWAQRGAGVHNDESVIDVVDCLFIGSTARSYYGGFFSGWLNSQTTLTRCIFRENSAFYGAGALGIGGGSATIAHCEFVGNTAVGRDSSDGGAIQVSGASGNDVSIEQCIFGGNKSSAHGGAIYQYRGQASLANCTFVGNVAAQGQAVACRTYEDDLAVLHATNCIFRDEGSGLFRDENAAFDIRYSNVRGGFPGQGNTNEDPCFVNPGYWDNLGTRDDPTDDIWVAGDYHLQSQAGYWSPGSQSWVVGAITSPCIDAGDPNSPVGDEPQPNGGRINMGAYGGTDQASRSSI